MTPNDAFQVTNQHLRPVVMHRLGSDPPSTQKKFFLEKQRADQIHVLNIFFDGLIQLRFSDQQSDQCNSQSSARTQTRCPVQGRR
mmetsp:Transcript_25854/g.53770  ORF Transcript_25854/g.53770 Transcript_25854/m.53770 type:complete len:85 (-) Transcript_25854:253-507(-)